MVCCGIRPLGPFTVARVRYHASVKRIRRHSTLIAVAVLMAASALQAQSQPPVQQPKTTKPSQKPPAAKPATQAKPASPPKADAAPVQSTRILITGVRVLDVETGAYLGQSAMLIDQGRIVRVEAKPPENAGADTIVLALKDATALPGLVDAHAYAAPSSDLDADFFYLLGLAHGVTGYRVIDARTEWAVAQRARTASGQNDIPVLSTSGRGIDQGANPGRWLFDAPDAASARAEVARQVAAGTDWIAGYGNLPADIYKAMAIAVKGSRTRLSGRPGAASMAELAAAGVHSIEGLAFPTQHRKDATDDPWPAPLTQKEVATLVSQLVRAKVTLVPMLAAARARAFPDDALKDESLQWLPEARRKAVTDALSALDPAGAARRKQVWASQLAFVAAFVKAGGKIATGSGFESASYPLPGIGLQREIAALVDAGLKPADVIRAATLGGAALIGAPDAPFGIKPGLAANLIIVQGDPLAKPTDLARVTHVMRAGRVIEPADLLARGRASVVTKPK